MGEVKLTSTNGLTRDLINGYSIFNGAKYFVEDESQNYLIFQSLFRYLKTSANNIAMTWKSKGLADESI